MSMNMNVKDEKEIIYVEKEFRILGYLIFTWIGKRETTSSKAKRIGIK